MFFVVFDLLEDKHLGLEVTLTPPQKQIPLKTSTVEVDAAAVTTPALAIEQDNEQVVGVEQPTTDVIIEAPATTRTTTVFDYVSEIILNILKNGEGKNHSVKKLAVNTLFSNLISKSLVNVSPEITASYMRILLTASQVVWPTKEEKTKWLGALLKMHDSLFDLKGIELAESNT